MSGEPISSQDIDKDSESFEKKEYYPSLVRAGERAAEFLKLNPNNRHDKEILEHWQIYKGTLRRSQAYERPCGIGTPGADNAVWIIHLDWDPTKGLHFNARSPYDHGNKLAACWTHGGSEDEFRRQLNAIAGLTAQQIWARWRDGNWIGPVPTSEELEVEQK